jgi:hypothetical protein
VRRKRRIAERARPFANISPIRGLLSAQFRRALQKLRTFLAIEMPHFPISRVEPELLMLHEFANQLDEVGGLESAARFEFRMIAPDPQRHAIAGIGQGELAIRLLLAGDLRRDAFHLDMDARFHHRAILSMPADFREGEQLHLRLRDADDTARNPPARITHRLRPIVHLLVDNDRMSQDGMLAAELQHIAFQLQMRFAAAVGLQVAEVARMMLGRVGRAVRLLCRIKMAASGCGVGRGTIAEFMDVKRVFARREARDIGHDLHGIAHFRERDSARYLAS